MAPITNPYAKRKAAPSSCSASASSSASTQQKASALSNKPASFSSKPPPAAAAAATASASTSNYFAKQQQLGKTISTGGITSFSQAFESIEDTSLYQQQIRKDRSLQEAASTRAEQRAFERETTTTTNSTTDIASSSSFTEAVVAGSPNAFQTDRDHHVLLQQPHVLGVSVKQKGNGVLNYIRNVPMTFQKMVPDYILSPTRCALFLSIKYHNLYPQYIYKRIAALKTDFELRILLVLVDVEDNAAVLLQLNKLAVTHNLTLILAWSEEEAGRYLETYKAFDGKDAKSIQKKEQTNFVDQVADFLAVTSKTGVNKTDAAMLLQQFGNVRSIAAAATDELALVPGMGEVKVRRLHDAFHKPFSSKRAKERKRQKMGAEENENEIKTETEEKGGTNNGNDPQSKDEQDNEENENS